MVFFQVVPFFFFLTHCKGPCVPLRVEANMQCGTKTANLTWEESDGVELYLATATSRTGTTVHCKSTKPTCHFSGLKCGEIYEFSVTAYSNMCFSGNSSTVETQTGRHAAND